MSKKTFSSIVFVVFTAFLLFSFSQSALAAKGIVKNVGSSGNAGSITVSDLGITDVGTLPSSKWYFFKEWGRGLERLFTFNSIKKVELELRITNEKVAEALKVQLDNPVDAPELTVALENYTKAAERFQARFAKLKETSENPNVEKLLEKLNEQTLKHAILFNQFVEGRNTDLYTEDANVINPQATRDNHLQGAVDVVQKKNQEIVVTAAQKDKGIEQKAEEQIQRADVVIHELESELAEFAINEPGVSNNKRAINTKGTGAVARTASEPGVPNEKTGPILQANCEDIPQPPAICAGGLSLTCVLDSAGKSTWQCSSARISTNMIIERQTPKRDFGDRMKAGLDVAGGMLANAKALFAEGKFGEAFGQARSAEVHARNGLRIIINNTSKPTREGRDADAPRIENTNSAMPIVPGTGGKDGKIVPETEKRVFPETNNRVFPETNNRTACDDRQAPGCLRGEILECRAGTWVCIGPATGGEKILNPAGKSTN